MAAKVADHKSELNKKVGEDDLQILHPHQTQIIAGKEITVREYGWVEGLKLRSTMQPIVADFQEIIERGQSPEGEDIEIILSKHAAVVVELIAASANVDIEFMETLSDEEGSKLELAWWGCNGHFFIQKAINNLARKLLEKKLRDGQISTPS